MAETINWGDLEALDRVLGGALTQTTDLLSQGFTLKASFAMKDAYDRACEYHERNNGLLTPDAIADRSRREMQGRIAEAREREARGGEMELLINDVPASQAFDPNQASGHAAPQCIRGLHRFGTLRGPNGEAQCLDCAVVFVAPPAATGLPPGAR